MLETIQMAPEEFIDLRALLKVTTLKVFLQPVCLCVVVQVSLTYTSVMSPVHEEGCWRMLDLCPCTDNSTNPNC